MPKKCDFQDIVGRRIGRLVIKEYLGKYRRHHKYLCECDCGNVCEVFRDNLLGRKPTSSCSHCWSIEDEGDHLRYHCSNGDSFILDRQDYKAAWQHRWFLDSKGYAKTTILGKTVEFSRFVLGADGETVVDHINRDTRDNRRRNLRTATRAQNARNESVRVTNQSGYKGVSLHKCGKYRADIGVDGRIIYLGLFSTKEDAARAYDDAARKYHKEFARVNYPGEGEQGCQTASLKEENNYGSYEDD